MQKRTSIRIHGFSFLILIVFLFADTVEVQSHDKTQTTLEVHRLRPQSTARMKWVDYLFPGLSKKVKNSFSTYLNQDVMNDVDSRLERVRVSGDPHKLFSEQEHQKFEKNLIRLKALESQFFKRWYLDISLSGAIGVQEWVTRRMSPPPSGEAPDNISSQILSTIAKNDFYEKWKTSLPLDLKTEKGPTTWGELLQSFQQDRVFRTNWIKNYPTTLPLVKQMTEAWAWEDTSVREVRVFHPGTPLEYWTLQHDKKNNSPNRFQAVINEDYDQLLALEYAPTMLFNRVTRVELQNEGISYQLNAIKKGRTMEYFLNGDEGKSSKRVFSGASLLRKLKMDEFVQRGHLEEGSLSLFLGPRTLQLNQVQALFELDPALVLSLGQFGFSITGGRAQALSVRTDTPQEQRLKWYASLVDIIDFAKSNDVDGWFKANVQFVLRAIAAGVGSGGIDPLPVLSSQADQSRVTTCRGLMTQ